MTLLRTVRIGDGCEKKCDSETVEKFTIICVDYMIYTTTPQWYSAGLRAGWSGVWASAGAGNFSLHHRVQTGPGAHQAS